MLGFSAAVQRREKLKHEIMLWIARNHSVCTLGRMCCVWIRVFPYFPAFYFFPRKSGFLSFTKIFLCNSTGIWEYSRADDMLIVSQFHSFLNWNLILENIPFSEKNKILLIVQEKQRKMFQLLLIASTKHWHFPYEIITWMKGKFEKSRKMEQNFSLNGLNWR